LRLGHRVSACNSALPDGYNLNVEEVGSGFPLIVLHGGPGLDHSMFRPYLDPLGDESAALRRRARAGPLRAVDPRLSRSRSSPGRRPARRVPGARRLRSARALVRRDHRTYHATELGPPPPTSSPGEATRARLSTPTSRPRSRRWGTTARRSPNPGRTRRRRDRMPAHAAPPRQLPFHFHGEPPPAISSKPSVARRFYATSPTQATATSTTPEAGRTSTSRRSSSSASTTDDDPRAAARPPRRNPSERAPRRSRTRVI
jgi:hypothetical protein